MTFLIRTILVWIFFVVLLDPPLRGLQSLFDLADRFLFVFQVLSGKYPTKSYYSTYEPLADSLDSLDDFGTETDRATLETIRKHGKKCNSVCCTGAFIIEVQHDFNEETSQLLFLGRFSPDA